MKKQRNRHTGKINAAKRRILETGAELQASDGRIYYSEFREVRGKRYRSGTMVRDFAAVQPA